MNNSYKSQKGIKRITINLAAIMFFLIEAMHANANGVAENFKDTLQFLAGITSAYAVHEAGHFLAAEFTDTEIKWEKGTYNQPIGFSIDPDSDDKGVIINSSGLLAQAMGAEIILQSENIDKNSSYVRGAMAWNIINPLVYALDYWFLRNKNRDRNNGSVQGDIKGIEYYSNEETGNVFTISIAAIAVLHGYRFLETQSLVPEMFKGKSNNLIIAPVSSGKFIVMYKYEF